MKTVVNYIYLLQPDEDGETLVRVSTPEGNLMINRVIQIFSQYPKERVEYPGFLEVEVYMGLYESVQTAQMMTLVAKDAGTLQEFRRAIYGDADELPELLEATVKSASYNAGRELLGKKELDGTGLALQQRVTGLMDGDDSRLWMVQMLKLRKRVRRFVHRHQAELDKFLALPDEAQIRELERRVMKNATALA